MRPHLRSLKHPRPSSMSSAIPISISSDILSQLTRLAPSIGCARISTVQVDAVVQTLPPRRPQQYNALRRPSNGIKLNLLPPSIAASCRYKRHGHQLRGLPRLAIRAGAPDRAHAAAPSYFYGTSLPACTSRLLTHCKHSYSSIMGHFRASLRARRQLTRLQMGTFAASPGAGRAEASLKPQRLGPPPIAAISGIALLSFSTAFMNHE